MGYDEVDKESMDSKDGSEELQRVLVPEMLGLFPQFCISYSIVSPIPYKDNQSLKWKTKFYKFG